VSSAKPEAAVVIQYWTPMNFKGTRVFVRSNASGDPVATKGLVDVRYSMDSGRNKVYRGSASNLGALDAPEPPIEVREEQPKTSADASAGGKDRNRRPGAKERPTVPTPRAGAVVLYTDGACTGNPGPAGSGVVMVDGALVREEGLYLGQGTNNIGELTAIQRGLELVADPTRPVDVYTDSDYAIGVLTRGWKAKANTELIAKIRKQLTKFSDLRLLWVPGHAGVPLNERADELARCAIRERRSSSTQLTAAELSVG
jgi:ribonuclease HI